MPCLYDYGISLIEYDNITLNEYSLLCAEHLIIAVINRIFSGNSAGKGHFHNNSEIEKLNLNIM